MEALPFIFLSLLSLSLAQTDILIDCGAAVPSTIAGRQWLPDDGYVSAGTSKSLDITVPSPILSTVRSFPLAGNRGRKFCYWAPVTQGGKYMVRSTYFYGWVNGRDAPPPIFDQIVDGTLWSVVNSTADFANVTPTFYEGVFVARGKTMSFCLGANPDTRSDPFISALEFVPLGDSLYNSTDFDNFALSLVARHSFGHSEIVRYPDDPYDRIWEPFGGKDPNPSRNRNVSASGMWNLPPSKVFETDISAAGRSRQVLELPWPPALLPIPHQNYSIAMYFADDRSSPLEDPRVLDVTINGVMYFKNLSLTQMGSLVFAKLWPLGGLTNITLTSAAGSASSPLINAGEVFRLMPVGRRTHTGDIIALEELKRGFNNPPQDWNGDPCMPRQYPWTGITCSDGRRIRVVTLNLTSMGLSGSIAPRIARLTALTDIWLGNNRLSGSIPDLSSLRLLQTLHLEDNTLSGAIPSSLGNISDLREIYLQNNDLSGEIPTSLSGKPGLVLRTNPGNHFLSGPPS
ncbi:Probable LRR receptor-like serine/threonine-protein kinase At1g67720 [Linum grandiflorum]